MLPGAGAPFPDGPAAGAAAQQVQGECACSVLLMKVLLAGVNCRRTHNSFNDITLIRFGLLPLFLINPADQAIKVVFLTGKGNWNCINT